MVFYFFGGIGIKGSCVDVGLVERVVQVHSESVKKFFEITFVRENTYTSQVEYIIVEGGQQGPCDRLVQGG